MTNRHANRRIDPDELRELGVPEGVIKEAVENAKLGLFAIAPPEDVIRETIDACEAYFPQPAAEEKAEWADVLEKVIAAFDEHPVAAAAVAAQPLLLACAPACISPGRVGRDCELYWKRPIVLLDNQNAISPTRWTEDNDLVGIRGIIDAINHIAKDRDAERSARVLVLRSSASQYDERELEAIRTIVCDETSDVWAIASTKVSKIAKSGRIIAGATVIGLETRPDSADDLALRTASQDGETLRARLCSFTPTPLKLDQHFETRWSGRVASTEGVRQMLKEIIATPV